MKKSSRSFLLLSLMALVMMTSRCDCGRGGTPSGRCEGAIGSLQVSDEIDSVSGYSIDYTQGSNHLRATFGNRKVRIGAVVDRATVLSGGVVLNLPSELPPGGGTGGIDGGPGGVDGGTGGSRPASPEIASWEFTSEGPRPRLREGTLERVLTFVDQRLATTLRLIFEDGTSLLCEFQLPHLEEEDHEEDPPGGGGCLGSSGGGGGDSD